MSRSESTASAAGTLDIGGDLTVNRLGFGAMRITGQGIPVAAAAARPRQDPLARSDLHRGRHRDIDPVSATIDLPPVRRCAGAALPGVRAGAAHRHRRPGSGRQGELRIHRG